MPRYYFDLHQGLDITSDGEGAVMLDLPAAHQAAISNARDVMVDGLTAGVIRLDCAIVIRDEVGTVAMTVPFGEAIKITPAQRG